MAEPAAPTSDQQQQQPSPADKGQQQPSPADKGQQQPSPADKGQQAQGDKTTPSDKGQQQQQQQAAPVVPDKYTLSLPTQTRLTADDVTQLEALARAKQLTNEQAQAELEAYSDAVDQQAAQWLAASQADKDYGGEKLAQSQQLANAALDHLRPKGTPRGDAFRAFLKRSGADNHPEVLAFLADLGQRRAEDPTFGAQPARSGGDDKPDLASRLYGHPDSKKLQEETTRGAR
jgi:hypothetical protein